MTGLRVTIFGAGRVGRELASTLTGAAGFDVTVVDVSEDQVLGLNQLNPSVRAGLLGAEREWHAHAAGSDVIVAAVPEGVIPRIAALAAEAGVHYLDFSPGSTAQATLASLAESRAVLNGCGVAPGLVESVAMSLVRSFHQIEDLVIRVGSLPLFPTNRLGYGQVWDIDGLIAEYTQACAVVRDGTAASAEPLQELEQLSIKGVPYEAFTTSRGLRDLDPFIRHGLRNVVFKTLRYPGHLNYIRFLLNDLDLRRRLYQFRSLLMNGLPVVESDELTLFLTARGHRDQLMTEQSVLYRFRAGPARTSRNTLTAVAAAHAASLLEMLRAGEVAQSGFIPQESVPAERLLRSEFLSNLLVESPPL